jgi:cation diffusion facilitator CzcD-associated flavoprotein CzcO
MCAGYFRYDRGYVPDFPGLAEFRGTVVHPQHWPAALDVTGKRVVVVGSGATAVTLVPELAKVAAKVTMLQRSPSYVVSLPSVDGVAERLKTVLPARAAHRVVRWKNIGVGTAFYKFCQGWPGAARRLIRHRLKGAVGDAVDVDVHFAPTYAPWDQRLCLVPDGDLFAAIAGRKAVVVTDRIEAFHASGIRLGSGADLPADVVVLATGLELQFAGGATVEVDGRPVSLPSTRMYMGAMLSDIPNLAFVMGYTNASWTLKCELVCDYVARVLQHMRDRGYRVACPREDAGMADRPAIQMSSGYLRRAIGRLPRQGTRDPWQLHQDYLRDRRLYRRHPIEDGVLELRV